MLCRFQDNLRHQDHKQGRGPFCSFVIDLLLTNQATTFQVWSRCFGVVFVKEKTNNRPIGFRSLTVAMPDCFGASSRDASRAHRKCRAHRECFVGDRIILVLEVAKRVIDIYSSIICSILMFHKDSLAFLTNASKRI